MCCSLRYYDTSNFKKTTMVDKGHTVSQAKKRKANEEEEESFDQGFNVFNPVMAMSMDMNKFLQSMNSEPSNPREVKALTDITPPPPPPPPPAPAPAPAPPTPIPSKPKPTREAKAEAAAVSDLDTAWGRCQQMALILASKATSLSGGIQDLKKASLLTDQLNQDVSHVVAQMGEEENKMRNLCINKHKGLAEVKSDLLLAAAVVKKADAHLRFIKTVNKAHASSSMSEKANDE